MRPKPLKKKGGIIPGIPMGHERRCLNQIRRNPTMKKDDLLWNGVPAGEFAMVYVMCGHVGRRRKATATSKEKEKEKEKEDDGNSIGSIDIIMGSSFVPASVRELISKIAAETDL